MTQRTDVHRPSALIPDDYTYVCIGSMNVTDVGLAMIWAEEKAIFAAHKARTGATFSSHEHGGYCHVCGSVNLLWELIFHHAPSNQYIKVGADCAAKLEMGYDRAALFALKEQHKAYELAKAGKAKAAATLAEAGLSAAWELATATDRSGFKREEQIIIDVVSKLVRYGSISEAQTNLIRKLLAAIPLRQERDAQRLAEKAAAPHWTAGRTTVEGTVLKSEGRESDWGFVVKSFIKLDDGRTCWGTIPCAGAGRGARVQFAANFTPTNDDPTHAFYNRPTKGKVLVPAPEVK